MPHRRPHGHQCVNVHNGKVSHILLKRFVNFQLLGTGTPPPANTIVSATCNDDDNGFNFNCTPIHQGATLTTPSKRLAIKIVSQFRIGGGGPLDGLLTFTLQIADGAGGTTDSPPIDVPVEYVDDPT
jgi:hypothetical protein